MASSTAALPPGGLGRNTLFVCIDMQEMFLSGGDWHCPDARSIVPACTALAQAAGEAAVFTRFRAARTAENATGSWRGFYRRWASVTEAEAGPEAAEIIPELRPLATPRRTFDKTGYGAFGSAEFAAFVRRTQADTLVISGIETDVCVMATVLEAVDLGLRVVLPRDALASGGRQAHDACFDHLFPRLDQQITVTDTSAILSAWSRL